MQVNSHFNRTQPQFGSINFAENATWLVTKSIKNQVQVDEFKTLLQKACNNDIMEIHIGASGKNLWAHVSEVIPEPVDPSRPYFFRSFRENVFTKMFSNKLGFIRKIVNFADKQAEIIKDERKLEEAIGKAMYD